MVVRTFDSVEEDPVPTDVDHAEVVICPARSKPNLSVCVFDVDEVQTR